MDINNISPYIPTQYVDYSTPDINAVNLNKAEVALQRVTAAANEAINAIKELNAAKIDTAKIVTSLASTDTLSVLSGAIGPVIDQRLTDLLNKYNQLNGEFELTNIKSISFRSTVTTGWLLHISIETNDSHVFVIGFDKIRGVIAYIDGAEIWEITPV